MLYPLSYGGVFACVNDNLPNANSRRGRLVSACWRSRAPSSSWSERSDQKYRGDDCSYNGHHDGNGEDVPVDNSACPTNLGDDQGDFATRQHSQSDSPRPVFAKSNRHCRQTSASNLGDDRYDRNR